MGGRAGERAGDANRTENALVSASDARANAWRVQAHLLYQRHDQATGRRAKGCPDMAADFDIKPHQDQWRAFTRLMTYSVVGSVVVLGLMALALL